MTQQDYDNDLVFRTNGEEYARIDGTGPWESEAPSSQLVVAPNEGLKIDGDTPPCISFNIGPAPNETARFTEEEIARFTDEGFYYKGEFIEDAGEVHRLLKDVLNGICYKQLCAELLAALEEEASNWNLAPEDHPLVERARAALNA